MKSKTNVLEVVKKHLGESILFTNEEYRPKGGLFIKPKPKTIRVDVIEINLLGSIERAKGLVNINIQHEDEERIDILTAVVKDVMESAFIEGYLFRITNEPITFRLSRTLYMKNIRTPFELEKGKYKLE